MCPVAAVDLHGDCRKRSGGGVNIEHENRNIVARFGRQRTPVDEILFVAARSGIVGGEEARDPYWSWSSRR